MIRGATERQGAALAAATGGLLVALGAALPWVTLYGGLHPLRGIIGPYGQSLLAGGIACAVAALALPRYPRIAGRILLVVAVVFLGAGSWLAVVMLPGMLAALRENPFLIAAAGPGPWFVIAGATVLGLASAAAMRRPVS